MVRQRCAASKGHGRRQRQREWKCRPRDDNRRKRRAGRAVVPQHAPTIERVLQTAHERGRQPLPRKDAHRADLRDWKTHLGVRGLRLEVDAAPRLGRLLLTLSIAYILAVLLGSGEIAPRVRAHSEVLRSQPRHGTRRRLSALAIGILALSLGRFADLAIRELDRLLAAFERGEPASKLTP